MCPAGRPDWFSAGVSRVVFVFTQFLQNAVRPFAKIAVGEIAMQQSARWKTFLPLARPRGEPCCSSCRAFCRHAHGGRPSGLAERAHRLAPGLDLTGGSRLVLEVSRSDIAADRLRAGVETIGNALRAARVPYSDLNGADDTIEVTVTAADRR
jgi:SecD/SecF fusion protein